MNLSDKGARFSRDILPPLLHTHIHCSLKNSHGYSAISEVIIELILVFTFSRRQIIADVNLFAVTGFDKMQILSSAKFNAGLTDGNKETSDL